MLLELEIRKAVEPAGVWLILVAGELDHETAPKFRSVFELATPPNGDGVVIDLSDLAFVDSSGLGALLELRSATESAGVRLAVVSTRRAVNRLFERTATEDVLGVVPTRELAIAAVAAGA
jgi:anti-sigma B factor antagonist